MPSSSGARANAWPQSSSRGECGATGCCARLRSPSDRRLSFFQGRLPLHPRAQVMRADTRRRHIPRRVQHGMPAAARSVRGAPAPIAGASRTAATNTPDRWRM